MSTRRTRGAREIFVLTAEEKKAVACLIGAFVLGLGTMHYRAKYPRPTPQSAKEQSSAKTAAGKTKDNPGRPSPRPTAERATD